MGGLRAIRFLRSRSQPDIIIQVGGYIYSSGTLQRPLSPYRPVRPHLHFSDITDGTGLNPFYSLHGSFNVVSLISHLGHYAGLFGQLFQETNLVNGFGHGLLHKDI